MNKEEKLALFLGMLSGDGCLSIKHNGEGYRNYPIQFCNTNKTIVELFNKIFFELFEIEGKISSRKRENRKEIWEFLKHSRNIVEELKKMGFPEGVKRDILRVPQQIINGSDNQKKYFMQGLMITDGSFKKYGGMRFHLGSKKFLEDISVMLKSLINEHKPVKEYVQKEKYLSYQLYLNKDEGLALLSNVPTCDNGTRAVLR